MLDSEPMMHSSALEARTTNYIKKNRNGHINALSYKKRTQIEIPRANSPTKSKNQEQKGKKQKQKNLHQTKIT